MAQNERGAREIFRRLYARGPCRAIKLRNGGSPLDVWRELHSLVKASRNSRRYRHRRGYINVRSYVLTVHPLSALLYLAYVPSAAGTYHRHAHDYLLSAERA